MNPGSTLPFHPTARHPKTGAPLRAVWVRPDGRVMWPMIGASDDDESGAGGGGDAGAGAGAGETGGNAGQSSDQGFPQNTPVADMTAEQQVAYWKHQARKHETRSTQWQQVAGGKTPDQIKAELAAAETLRQEQMTDAQRQVEEAKQQAKAETVRVVGTSAARTVLEIALGHDPEKNDRSSLIETLDLTKLLNDDGSVDTDKVRALVSTIAPSDKGQGQQQRHDYGAGSRNGNNAGGGLAAGRDRYHERHGKKTATADA